MNVWFNSDWGALIRPSKYNWSDFTVVRISFEQDHRFGRFEWHLALMGLHFGGSVQSGAADADFMQELRAMVDEIDSGTARVSITLAELNELRAKAGETNAEGG